MSAVEHLPLVTSFEETVRDWPKLEARQKIGAAAALIVTTARPILRHLTELRRGQQTDISTRELVMNIALDISDKLDGALARKSNGVTALGKELDPLMDKIDFAIQEISQYRRGMLPLTHVAVRLARDVVITLVRAHVKAATNGKVDISAGWHGKVSTAARLISLRVTDLPFEQGRPLLRKAHQSLATSAILGSGAVNVKKLLDAKATYQDSHRTY